MTADLVVGATGALGAEIVRALVARGSNVRALVRSSSHQSKLEALTAAGVELVQGDLKDPESLRGTCEGVTNVITTASSTLSRAEGDTIESVDRDGSLNLLRAAQDAGVGHFVYVSFPPMEPSHPLQDAKRAVEAAIRESGISYTILQPTMFWDVWCSAALGFDVENAKVRIWGSGEGRHSWISMFDVKAAVIASLNNPAAENKTFVLGGAEAMTQNEIVRRFEKAAGRSFEREHVPLAALQEQYDSAPDSLQKSVAGLMLECAQGNREIDMAEVRATLGIELTSIDSYIKQVTGK